jgi:alpha-L-fucosidase
MIRRYLSREGAIGALPPPTVYDYRAPEYQTHAAIQQGKWECVRGIDMSFGYNRNSRPEDFLSHQVLIHSWVDIVSKNGNLLLNVGLRAEDARIPEVQLARLRWLGDFLAANGEAIYGTRPWKRAEGTTRQAIPVRFTMREGKPYATLLGTPPGLIPDQGNVFRHARATAAPNARSTTTGITASRYSRDARMILSRG